MPQASVSPEQEATLRVLQRLRDMGTAGTQGFESGGAIDPQQGTIGRPLDNIPAYQNAQARTHQAAQGMVQQEVASRTGEGPEVPGGLPGGEQVEELIAQVVAAVVGDESLLEKLNSQKKQKETAAKESQ